MNMQTLKIGSRVRFTDDGAEGRIIWANGVSVKIRWDDGEQVTWRRDSLADRPIEILDAASEDDQHAETAATEQTIAEPLVESSVTAPAEQPSESLSSESIEELETDTPAQAPAVDKQAEEAPPLESSLDQQNSPEQMVEKPDAPSTSTKQPKMRKPKKAADDGQEKKLSALDAAAKVLAETGQAMSCQELIGAMGDKGYWTSPGGKTPQATLYSAIAREITTKGPGSRFAKAERGKFALANAV
jgi:hypothetical protein